MNSALVRYVPAIVFIILSVASFGIALVEVLHRPLTLVVIGLLFSSTSAVFSHRLIRRLGQLQRVRDRAVNEAAAREVAQNALVESESRYRSVFDSASDGLVVLDADGVIIEANRAAAKMFALSPQELSGAVLTDLVTSTHDHLWYELREQLDIIGVARLELRLEKEERAHDIEVRSVAFSHGDQPRILASLTDMSHRKRAEERLTMLSRKALVAQEEERARISRELHDELGQLLTATRFELGLLRKHAANTSEDATRAFESSVGLIEKAAVELRHICRRLRPPMLDDLGLEPAVQQLVDEFTGHTGLEVDEEIELHEERAPLPKEVTLCAYRVLQESLTNVGRHAQAKSVVVSLIQTPHELRASIYDDGQGFEGGDLASIEGSGMTGMRERASLVGGSLTISSAPYQGTRIDLRIPLRDMIFEEAT